MSRWTIRETGYLVGMASAVPLINAVAILHRLSFGSAPVSTAQIVIAGGLVAAFLVMAYLSKWMMDHTDS